MGVFQAPMVQAMKSLRDEKHSMKKASEATTQTSVPTRASDHSDAQPMDTDVYGPPLPPKFTQSVQSDPASKHSDLESDHHSEQPKRVCCKAKKHSGKKKHKVRAKYYSQSSSSEEDESSAPIKKSSKLQQKAPSEPEHPQDSTDPVFYREVEMSDLPSQYAEEVETFRQILELPDPRETLPRSSTTVIGLNDEKGQQELRPRGPLAMLPLNSILNLNKISWPLIYLRVNISNPRLQHPNSTRWDNLVLKTKSRSSIQFLLRSVFLLSPLGPLWARFPYKFSRNLNTKLGRISLPSISRLLSLRLPLLVTLLCRSVSKVSRLPLRGLKDSEGC